MKLCRHVPTLNSKDEKILKGASMALIFNDDATAKTTVLADGTTVTRTCAWSPPGCHAVGCGVRLFVKDGELVKVEGDPEHPLTQGNRLRIFDVHPHLYFLSFLAHSAENLAYRPTAETHQQEVVSFAHEDSRPSAKNDRNMVRNIP
jgi:hypothetical protein